jgi:hypothetical protein
LQNYRYRYGLRSTYPKAEVGNKNFRLQLRLLHHRIRNTSLT